MADSNIDWGQDSIYLREYASLHPDAVVNPCTPRSGRIVVGVNLLTGVIGDCDFAWLRDNFTPVDRVAYSYLVFVVSPQDLRESEPHDPSTGPGPPGQSPLAD